MGQQIGEIFVGCVIQSDWTSEIDVLVLKYSKVNTTEITMTITVFNGTTVFTLGLKHVREYCTM